MTGLENVAGEGSARWGRRNRAVVMVDDKKLDVADETWHR